MMEKKRDILLAVIALIIALTVIIVAAIWSHEGDDADGYFADNGLNISDKGSPPSLNWTNIPLKDIKSKNVFRISDFKDKPVIVLSFTVPCPICTAQQQEIMKLRDRTPDSFVFVALDIDPNENDERIVSHIRTHNFSGYYAVSPPEMTRSLINEFGIDQITPSSAPIIFICNNSRVYAFAGGLKSVDLLQTQLEIRC